MPQTVHERRFVVKLLFLLLGVAVAEDVSSIIGDAMLFEYASDQGFQFVPGEVDAVLRLDGL
jgi:hypothetical protein